MYCFKKIDKSICIEIFLIKKRGDQNLMLIIKDFDISLIFFKSLFLL